MFRRALAVIAASAVALGGLTFGATPVTAAVTGASISPSTLNVGASPAFTVRWTEGVSRSSVMVRSPYLWGNAYSGTINTPSSVAPTSVTGGGANGPWVITCPLGVFTLPAASTVTGTLACRSANQPAANAFFTAFWLDAAAGAGNTLSYTGAVEVSVNSGTVTAPGTPRRDTWIVGQYSTANTATAIAADGNVEVPVSVVAVDAAGIPIPVITLNIDSNEGTCSTQSVTGLQGSWTTAPGADNCSKPGARFVGYNTERNGSGIAIAPGGNLNLSFDNTIYAIYESPRTAGAPTDVVAVAGRNKITVSWKAPADAGTSAITNYLAQANPSGRVCVTRTSDANMLSCTFDLGATNTKYSFKVQALNGAGWGPVSAESAAVSPYDFREVSGSRANVLLGLAGTKVETNGAAPGLAGLAVTPEYKVGGAANWTGEANAARVNADGKFSWSKRFPASANKQNVTVRFTYGGDIVSDTLVLSRGGQSGSLTAPRNIKVENVVNRVIVTWDPPKFDGGEKITGYTMCANGAGSLCRNVPADGRGVFQNLATGREYTITVAAKTATRTGPAAEAKQKVSPVEASVRITRRFGQEIRVETEALGFKAGAKFRLEVAVAEPGRPTNSWRWDELQSFTGKGNVRRGFTEELGASYEGEAIAVRLVTPNGPVYSRLSRP